MTKATSQTAVQPAQEPAPEIPKTMQALFALMYQRLGTGAVFLAMVLWLYNDGKAKDERYAKQSEATVTAILTIANSVEKATTQVQQMQDAVRRIESGIADK